LCCQAGTDIRVVRIYVGKDVQRPVINEGGVISDVCEFVLVDRKYKAKFPKLWKRQYSSEVCRALRTQAKAHRTYLVALTTSGSLAIYDGLFPLCVLSPRDLMPVFKPLSSIRGGRKLSLVFTDGSSSEVHSAWEVRDWLARECLCALFTVLPKDLYNNIHSDLVRKLLQSRVRKPTHEDVEKGSERSGDWAIFYNIVISLIKDGKQRSTQGSKPRLAYSDDRPQPGNSWTALMTSSFHAKNSGRFSHIFTKPSTPVVLEKTSIGSSMALQTSPSSFARYISEILQTLHLLYEDLKLDELTKHWCREVGLLLCAVARMMGAQGEGHVDHYLKDYPELQHSFIEPPDAIDVYLADRTETEPLAVPCIQSWLLSIIKGVQPQFMPVLFERTRKVCKVFEVLTTGAKSSGPSPLMKKRHSFTRPSEAEEDYDDLPVFGSKTKQHPVDLETEGTSEQLLDVLVKESFTVDDLARLPTGISSVIIDHLRRLREVASSSSWLWKTSALELIGRSDLLQNLQTASMMPQGQQHYDHILELELTRFEDPAITIFTEDLRLEEAEKMLDVTRVMKLHKPEFIGSEEHFETEKHNLLFKLCIRRAASAVGYGSLKVGTKKASATEASGVAKICYSAFMPPNFSSKLTLGLPDLNTREKDFAMWPAFHAGVAAGLQLMSDDPQAYVRSRQWITYQRSEAESHEHAGFIFALGLMGQLEALHELDIYRYLQPQQDSIIVAIYLGKAASALGSMDEKIMKVLRLSISFLIPSFIDMEVKLVHESAAMMGFGLLYYGSANRQVTEMLLVQLGRKPLTNRDIERECMTLASGFALGLVNLATGATSPGLEDLRIDERLIRLFEGGRRIAPPKILNTGSLASESAKCSVAREGENVMVSITAPGALMAYSLIHLKSNDELVASKIELPGTFYALEAAKSDLVMLKVIARNLILWDNISPSSDWLNTQLPEVLRFCFENDLGTVKKVYEDKEVDFPAVANCYVCAIGGCLLSIGLKHAGTCDRTAAHFVSVQLQQLRRLRTQSIAKLTDQTKNNVDKHTLFTVLCTGVLAVGLIMAGSGDVESFRLVRTLRKRLEPEAHYGYNMAIHMALGFLFLGNGKHSFKQDNLSVAMLLCAVYPKFPSAASDNRFHLQALRHFYTFAVSHRLLVTIDADTEQVVSAPVTVSYQDRVVEYRTPVLLQPGALEVVVDNDEFYQVRAHFPVKQLSLKRKAGKKFLNSASKELEELLLSQASLKVSDIDFALGCSDPRAIVSRLSIIRQELEDGHETADLTVFKGIFDYCQACDKLDVLSMMLDLQLCVSRLNWPTHQRRLPEIRQVIEAFSTGESRLFPLEYIERLRKVTNSYLSQVQASDLALYRQSGGLKCCYDKAASADLLPSYCLFNYVPRDCSSVLLGEDALTKLT
jgi:hypothetical protein